MNPDLAETEDPIGVACFIDNNCLEMAVTGSGPLAPGSDAPRYGDEVQRAMYNGWKSIHGSKDQTVDGATGHTWDLFGPLPVRQNDLYLLRQSKMLERWKDSIDKIERPIDFPKLKIFGDSAYKTREHLFTYFNRQRANELASALNHGLKAVRITIEWNYGRTVQLFKSLLKKDKLKAMAGGDPNALKMYVVATLFRNFHAWLYGCETSNYFNISFSNPEELLRKYIMKEDF